MINPVATSVTFGLLALAICAVWLPPLQVGRRAISPWIAFFCAALAAGVIAGFVTWAGVAGLGIFALCAYLASHSETQRLRRIIFTILTVLLALALALHALPGFNNPVLVENIQFSADAMPFTQNASFDKAAAGLIMLALLCKRASHVADWREIALRSFAVAVMTTVAVIATAISIGYVKPDVKFSWYAPIFLVTNLLFTCVAEEAFFRGFLQERLSKVLPSSRVGAVSAVLCSALLFGVAHFGGGFHLVFLATLGGVGYGYVYFAVKRVEAPIIVHFVLNAVHFIGFTYPQLSKTI